MWNVPIPEKSEKKNNMSDNISQVFSDKVTPAIDYRDKPVVECDVLIVKKYFCRWLQIIIQVIIQNMIVNKLWCEYLMHCFWN